MQFNRKNNRYGKILINSLIVGAVFIFLLGPLRELYVESLKLTHNVNKTVSQTIKESVEVSTSSINQANQQKQKIKEQEIALNQKNFQLRALSTMARKADSLSKLLNLHNVYFPKSIPASIIARSPSSWNQQILINKGSADNLFEGMVVVSTRGVVGQIQEVKPNYSVVQLVSSSQLKFGAEIQRTKTMGVLFGDKPGYAHLKFVPIGSDVQKGDVVQTTSISPFHLPRYYPFAFPVGRIIEVNRLANNSEMFIRIKLFEDVSRSQEVLVLMPGDNLETEIKTIPLSDINEEKQMAETSPKNAFQTPPCKVPYYNEDNQDKPEANTAKPAPKEESQDNTNPEAKPTPTNESKPVAKKPITPTKPAPKPAQQKPNSAPPGEATNHPTEANSQTSENTNNQE